MKYFLHINGHQQGPFEIDELLDNGLTPETPVWCDGMADWAPAKDVQDLSWLLAPVQSTPPQFNTQAPPAYGPKLVQQQVPMQQQYVSGDVPPCRSGLALAILNLCAPIAIWVVLAICYENFHDFRYYSGMAEVCAGVVVGATIITSILGTISLIFAITSKVAYGRGQYEASRKRGKVARTLGWIGLILAIVVIAFVLIMAITHNYDPYRDNYYGYY